MAAKRKRVRHMLVGLQYAAVLAIIFVLFYARIDTDISPFAVAFCYASVMMPVNKFVIAAGTFMLSFFTSSSQSDVIATAYSLVIFLVMSRVLTQFAARLKKPWAELLVILGFYAAGQAFFIWNSLGINENFFKALVAVLAGGVFAVCCIVTCKTAYTRTTRIPWTADQKICAAVFVTVLALGLSAFENQYFSVLKFIAVFVILTGVCVLDRKDTIVIAVCFGLGQSLATFNLNYVAVYTLICLSAIAFASRDRYFSLAAVIVTDIVLGTYFGAYISYNFFSLIPLSLAAVCAVFASPAAVKRLGINVEHLSGSLISKNTINRNRAGIYVRLNNLSAVFNEMQNIYKGLVHGQAPHSESAALIASQVVENVCENCINKTTCGREAGTAARMREAFESAAFLGLQWGKVTFMDLSPEVTMKCAKTSSILSNINTLLDERRSREVITQGVDGGKMLMANLLSGLVVLCSRFAEDVCRSVVFDNDKAELIKEELLYKSIVSRDCLITKSGNTEYSVSVLVGRKDAAAKLKDIERAVSRVCAHNMIVDSVDDADTAGFSIVTVVTAPRYALVFGAAQVSKNFNERNGDTFSFLKVNNEKTLMAVCDGMGAGERAERASVLALSLVENFYKAGFPHEIIMTSVNQLLSVTQQEIFSALDIAVFNLTDGCVDFIKVGASDGYIKRDREVEVVTAGSLPLGVLEEMQPKITRAVLGHGDMVVLCSDGAIENFGDRIGFANFINNVETKNPQDLADEIMQECLNRSGRAANDDCTVLVARIFERTDKVFGKSVKPYGNLK